MRISKIKLAVIFGVLIVSILVYFFFIGDGKKVNVNFGFTFSQKYAQELDIDWKKAYLEMLDDLGFKKARLIAYWDLIEPEKDKFDFADLDFQIKEAEKRGVEVLVVFGKKTPRWPECHIPIWAKSLEDKEFENELFDYIKTIVQRYKKYNNIKYWQVENEPFFSFGDECKASDYSTIKKEVELVKSLDRNRKIVVTDSGEFGSGILPALIGDIVGFTIYKDAWISEINRKIEYPFSPELYIRKAKIIERVFDKKVIGVETQAEPWGKAPLPYLSLEEQIKLMSLENFKDLFNFAQITGIQEQYLWGAEWWYFMKEKGHPEYWEYVKTNIQF